MREMLMCALMILVLGNTGISQSAPSVDKLTIQSYEQDGQVNEITLEGPEARAVDIPQFINENRHLRRLIISGIFKNAENTDIINFDSNKLVGQDGAVVCKEVKTSTRPFLGVAVDGRDDLAGVDVKRVYDYSAADIGGIVTTETLLSINEEVINSYCDLQRIIRSSEIGQLVTVAVKSNSKERTIQVRMGQRELNNISYVYCDEVPLVTLPLQSSISTTTAGFNSYPNPTRSITQWNFNSDSNEPVILSVVDMKGKIIHQENHDYFSGNLSGIYNFEHENNGTYLLLMRQGEKIYESKVLLMKI